MAINPKMLKAAIAKAVTARATGRVTSAAKEAREAADMDLARRQAARTILNPNEVSGEYDAGRALATSLGGQQRPITLDDLRAFQENVKNLKKTKQFKQGITAQGVIDLALDADKERANSEIRMAIPARYRGAVFHFITNAGPGSEKTRHHVDVEFLDFQSQVAASSLDPKKIGKAVAKGRLSFNCDCERHTFWFRYIATIGHFNYGRAETGYPKIRNPRLQGVACKHVLRTMHVILKDAAVHTKIAGQVIAARQVLDARQLKTQREKAADVRAHADAQQGKRRASTNIKTSVQKSAEAAKRKARSDMAKKAADKLPKVETDAQKTKRLRTQAAQLQSLLASGILPQAAYDAAMANLESQK